MARPRKPIDPASVRELRARGLSWREVAKLLAVGEGTARRAAAQPAKTAPKLIQGTDGIVSNHDVGFGRPVLAGTGIRTAVVASRFKAGETIAELALDYRLSESQIEAAIRFELS